MTYDAFDTFGLTDDQLAALQRELEDADPPPDDGDGDAA